MSINIDRPYHLDYSDAWWGEACASGKRAILAHLAAKIEVCMRARDAAETVGLADAVRAIDKALEKMRRVIDEEKPEPTETEPEAGAVRA